MNRTRITQIFIDMCNKSKVANLKIYFLYFLGQVNFMGRRTIFVVKKQDGIKLDKSFFTRKIIRTFQDSNSKRNRRNKYKEDDIGDSFRGVEPPAIWL